MLVSTYFTLILTFCCVYQFSGSISEKMLNNPPHDKNRIAVVSVLCNTEFPFYFSLWVNLIRKFTPFNTDIVILTAGQLTENIFLEKGLTVHTISNDSILSVRSCKVSAIHAFQMAEFDKIIFPCSTCVMSKITSDFFMSTLNSISLFSYINLFILFHFLFRF